MSAHVCEVSEDDDGWLIAACACGWSFGPVPDWETAADCVGDHREAAGRAHYAELVKAARLAVDRWDDFSAFGRPNFERLSDALRAVEAKT